MLYCTQNKTSVSTTNSPSVPRISATAIEEARGRIRREFLDSRQLEVAELSRAVRARLLCKIESENAVGSFKGRGTDSFVQALPPTVKALVTASAGNFGLALADSGKRRGVAVTVYAAETASPIKLDRIRSAGGTVKLVGRDFDEAKDHARAAAARMNLMFVEDGREPAIAAGAGTMAMELTAGAPPIDTVLVPLGNGALLAGIGCWFRAHSPKTRIIGVCAEGAPAMALSWRTHTVQSTPRVDTIADGIAVRVPVPEALADLQDVVDDIVLVSDNVMKQAMKLIYKHLNLIVEPSSVVGVAALLSYPALADGRVSTPITAGNVTRNQVQMWIPELEVV
jgi:threonine dehydratase